MAMSENVTVVRRSEEEESALAGLDRRELNERIEEHLEGDPVPPEAYDEVLAKYEKGDPFFTREAIRIAGEQSQIAKGSEETLLVVRDVRGFDIVRHFKYDHPETRSPRVYYRTVQNLLTRIIFHPSDPYLNTSVVLTGRGGPVHYKVLDVDGALVAACQEWQEGEYHDALKKTLLEQDMPYQIKKIVGFAFGSISEGREDTRRQHAILLAVRDVLQERQPTHAAIETYVQEPNYTEADKQALGKRDVVVVEDPEGFLLVDDSTVVLSFGPDVPVKQIVLDIAKPAILIWDSPHLVSWESEESMTDPDTERTLKQCREGYSHHDLLDVPDRLCRYSVWIRHA